MKALAVVVLSVWTALAVALTARAQSITTIYSFTNGPAYPEAPLALGPDGNYYGTTSSGGTGNAGTVFRVTTNGMVTTLVNFANSFGQGASPQGSLALGPDGNFYGTTWMGGIGLNGTVFQVTTNGALTTLASFMGTNGARPLAGLTVGPDGSFYGTTTQGGSYNLGTVFKVTTNGVLTTLASFNGTNGADPIAGLTVGQDGNFYGTTYEGGITDSNANPGNINLPALPVLGEYGYGTVFQITTNGVLTTLVSFDNTNGAYPRAGLTLGPDGNLYGTASDLSPSFPPFPGQSRSGTVFQITTNGALTTLASFYTTNGAAPEASLTLGPDGNLYGTTHSGGSNSDGTVFMVTTNGTLTTLVNLNGTNGIYPQAALTLGSDGNFYGTTTGGGSGALGTVFQLTTNGAWTTLANFANANGADPNTALTLGRDGNFYGTTYYFNGIGSRGTIFQVTPTGTVTTLTNFDAGSLYCPNSSLALGPDGNFYGTTYRGGDFGIGYGTVFEVTPNGAFTTLVNFDYVTNGAQPEAPLTLGPDGNFYGTTYAGGSGNYGTMFQLTTNGTLTTLANFNLANGATPVGGLTLGLDGNFYGTTYTGGSRNKGTVFMVTTNGTLTTLVNFNTTNGANPVAALTLGPDGDFYGTTPNGGDTNSNTSGYGTVFRITTNGTLTTLFCFERTNGCYPAGSLALGPDGNFYGITSDGGSGNAGTVFKVTPNGTLTTLASFNLADGINPQAGLTLGPDGNFYGTTFQYGVGGGGTIFQLNLPPDFITAPAKQIAVVGGTATFNSQVFGTAPFTYQWLSNGVAIDGATNATLSVSPASTNATASYQLVVSNAFGSVMSQTVSLNVLAQPNIYAISNNGGSNFTLSLVSLPNTTNRLWATTNMALPFAQWQVIGTNVTDGNGLSQFLDTNTAGMPQKFYRLSQP